MCGVVERLLAKRGISGAELEEFLDPSLKRLADATELPGIREAVEAIIPFVRDRRPIVVFGDYDCDGVCACTILVRTICRLGGDVEAFMPQRFDEGYGMTPKSVERMVKEHPDVALVVSVDCGVTSAKEVKWLKDRGIAVVVTDHHLPPEELPECDALVDPKVPGQRAGAAAMGAQDICGAGVAFFLANALTARAVELGLYGGEKFSAPLLVLAGLATVVDIVPMLKQNRILSANAMRSFWRRAPLGLRELMLRAQRRAEDMVTSHDFGFVIGPRINAAGRVASAEESYRLLMAEEREEARSLAQRIEVLNVERKSVENGMTEQALAQVPEGSVSAVVVNSLDGTDPSKWSSGVCGIVASRILGQRGVPVAVAVDGHGSVRAPEGYDVHAALSACAEFLERFGGHTAAGGFTVKEGMFEEFRAAFMSACEAQKGGAVAVGEFREPELWLGPEDLTMELHEDLMRLEPFGEGNPEPVFGLRGVALTDARQMGGDGRHAAFSFAGGIPRATWWGHGNDVEELRGHASGRFDITFTLGVSEWGGDGPRLELRLCDVRLVPVSTQAIAP